MPCTMGICARLPPAIELESGIENGSRVLRVEAARLNGTQGGRENKVLG